MSDVKTYDEGASWAVKYNDTPSSDGKPYWIRGCYDEARARRIFAADLKDSRRRYPTRPDKWPELLHMQMVWAVQSD